MNKISNINSFLDQTQEVYFHDLYVWGICNVTGTTVNKYGQYIQDTHEVYSKNHPDTDIYYDKRKSIISELKEVLKKGIPVYFQGKIILRELYKIFYLIDMFLYASDLMREKSYGTSGLVYFETGDRVDKQISTERSYLIRPKVYVNNVGDHRLNNYVLTGVKRDKFLTKFFLNIFILQDVEKLAFLYEDRELTERLFNLIRPFTLQQTTTNKVIKSFSILLASELRGYLGVAKGKAIEITRNATYELFGLTSNLDELDKYVWLDSSLYNIPIFSASRTDYWKASQKDLVLSKVQKTGNELGLNFSHEFLQASFDSLHKSPHNLFLRKYPMEFLLKNPKYSYLDNSALHLNYQC